MAYHGYLNLMSQYCINFFKENKKPAKVLKARESVKSVKVVKLEKQ